MKTQPALAQANLVNDLLTCLERSVRLLVLGCHLEKCEPAAIQHVQNALASKKSCSRVTVEFDYTAFQVILNEGGEGFPVISPAVTDKDAGRERPYLSDRGGTNVAQNLIDGVQSLVR